MFRKVFSVLALSGILVSLLAVPSLALAVDEGAVTNLCKPGNGFFANVPAARSDANEEDSESDDAGTFFHELDQAKQFCIQPTCANLVAFEAAKGDTKPVKEDLLEVYQAELSKCSAQEVALSQSTNPVNVGQGIKQALEVALGEEEIRTNCVRLDILDRSLCDPTESNEPDFFTELQRAMANGYPLAILEEPIGTENVVNRLRICQSSFVRDAYGNLQRRDLDSSNTSIEGKFSIVPSDCQEYFVRQCRPNNTVLGAVELSLGSNQEEVNFRWDNDGDGNLDDNKTLPVLRYCSQVQVLFDSSGTGVIKEYVSLIYRFAASFIGVIAVIVVMVSGIQISISSDSSQVDEARDRIVQSLVALALLFLSGLILYAINPTFFRAEPTFVEAQPPSGQLEGDPLPPSGQPGTGDIPLPTDTNSV